MPVVFFSYRSSDRAVAERIIAALEQDGITIWFDRQLNTGEEYRSQIQRQLDTSDLVIALWTQNSVRSAWVINEADAANSRGALISIVASGTLVPERFRWTVAANINDRLAGPTRAEYLAIKRAVRYGLNTFENQYVSMRISKWRTVARLTDYGGTALAPLILAVYSFLSTNALGDPRLSRMTLPDVYGIAAAFVIMLSVPIYFLGRVFEYLARGVGWINAGNSRLRVTALWVGEFLSLTIIVFSIWIFETKSAKEVFETGLFAAWDLVVIGIGLCVFLAAAITLPKFIPFFLSPRLRRALLS